MAMPVGMMRVAAIVAAVSLLPGCKTELTDAAAEPPRTAAVVAYENPATAAPAPSLPKTADAPQVLSDSELADGWIALFDQSTLFGWKANSDANWRVEERSIVVDGDHPGLLCTTTQFGNYVFRADFRSEKGTNSGIFLHTPFKPTDPGTDCYELNIAPPDNPFPTCSLVKRAKAEGDFESRDWQTFEVTIQDGSVKISLNGKQVLDYTDPKPLRRGYIGLQLNQGKVAFRNIRLKPLGMTPLFNGQDLAGWKQYPDMKSKFTVTSEGWIDVKDGRGQLETEKSYGDFALQLECISHAKELNSGVFFRCIPGEQMNGYECQIHNGFKNNDRTQPMDCGTGGIFRRQNARLVAADDLAWFHLTLIAEGNRMASWVNGFPVCNFQDDRAAHPNPRNGRRDEPGTLMLQGHDPTTNLSFRNLRIAELAERN